MVGDGHRHRAEVGLPLHGDMTAQLSDRPKSVLLQDAADFSPGEHPESTHGPLRIWLRTPACEAGARPRPNRRILEQFDGLFEVRCC